MGYPIFSIEYSGTLLDTNLTNSIIINTKDGLKTTVGTSDFQIQNIDDDNVGKFKIDDSVDIYMGYATGSTQIFSGFVNEISEQCDMKQRNIKISCVNKMERLLSHLDAKDYPAGITASDVLKDTTGYGLIARINGLKKGDEPNITTNNVTTTTKVITPYGYNFRPAMEILRELATPEFNGTSDYFIYYIDKNNDLHFKPRPGPIVTTPTVNEYNFTEFRATYGVFDVINAVIVNCGTDINGETIIARGYNISSITEVGYRWKYILKTEIGNYYKKRSDMTLSQQRNAMREAGESWGFKYTKILGEPRWKIDATMKGNYNYPNTTVQMVIGEVVRVTSPSNWSGTKVLRVVNLSHNFTINGWMTTLQLEEDDKTKVVT